MLYKVTAAIINKVNLTQKLGSICVQWFRSNDCEIMIMWKQPSTSDQLFYLFIWLL